MDIISRKDAKRLRLKRYFTGKPCKHGHIAPRRTLGSCIECSKAWSKDKDARRYSENPEYFAQKNKRWMDRNKERRSKYIRTRRQSHLIAIAEQTNPLVGWSREEAFTKGYLHYRGRPCKHGHDSTRLASSGHCLICNLLRTRKDRANNPGRYRSYKAKRRTGELNALPVWLTLEHIKEIETIYSMAATLTKQTGIQHDVDHRVPLLSEIVHGLHVPENLQVILHTENMIKSNKFDQEDESSRYLLWLKSKNL